MEIPPSRQTFIRWDLAAFWLYLLLLVVLFGTSQNPADPDLWWHFAFFDFLRHTGHFPSGDVFSYDAYPQVVPDHEWGDALIFYPVYFWAGPSCLVLLKLVIIGATLSFTVRAALGNRAPTMLDTFFFSLVLLAMLSSLLSTVRAAAFTHLFFALWVLWFQREREGHQTPALAYVATMIAKSSGRTDVTAMPYGPSVPHMFIVVFVIMALVLILRPAGLFGKDKES